MGGGAVTKPPQPADPLDLASIFAILALVCCPDHVRAAMIAVLGESVTPEQHAHVDELLAMSDAELEAVDISPEVRALLQATRFPPDDPPPPQLPEGDATDEPR